MQEYPMSTFDCLIRFGHMGAGRALERYVRLQAYDAVDAMRRAKSLPGVKKGRQRFNGASVLRVQPVR
jgi:hypothetical protein